MKTDDFFAEDLINSLMAQIERLETEIERQKVIGQSYYNEAVKGWEKFRRAETELAHLRGIQ